MASDDKLISAREAAKILGIRISTLYSWTSKKAIPFISISRNMIKFDPAELQAWIEARRIEEIGSHKKRPPTREEAALEKGGTLPKEPPKETIKDNNLGSDVGEAIRYRAKAWVLALIHRERRRKRHD
jgi:excisionase family DNA binding protein